MNAAFDAGYVYELAGLVYYVFFLILMRRGNVGRYSQRTRVLVIVAAIALVGSVPFHYATSGVAAAVMIALGVAGVVSAFIDARAA